MKPSKKLLSMNLEVLKTLTDSEVTRVNGGGSSLAMTGTRVGVTTYSA